MKFWISVILGILVISGGIGFWIYGNAKDYEAGGSEAKPSSEEYTGEEAVKAAQDVEKHVEEYAAANEDKIGESEEAIRQAIHDMSHQKIYASDKWGALAMSEENILTLISRLDKFDYVNEDVYRDILTRWKNGSFERAVEDHNRIWKLQNGNMGEAQRLLTPEEEKEWVEERLK